MLTQTFLYDKDKGLLQVINTPVEEVTEMARYILGTVALVSAFVCAVIGAVTQNLYSVMIGCTMMVVTVLNFRE